MTDERTLWALERLIVVGGVITSRAATAVPSVASLSLAQSRVLAFIATSSDGLRVGELARRRYTPEPQAASKIVRRLEARGLVRLERGTQADGRAVVVRLTALGEDAWSEVSARRRELLADALASVELPADARAAFETVAAAIERRVG